MPSLDNNMLAAKSASSPYGRTRRALRLAVIVLLTLCVASGVGAFVAFPLYLTSQDVLAHLESGKIDLGAAEQYAGRLRIKDSLHRLELAQAEFDSARRDLEKLTPLRMLPPVARKIEEAEDLLLGGLRAVSAVRDAMASVSDIIDLIAEGQDLAATVTGALPDSASPFKDVSPERKRAVLASLELAGPRIGITVRKIDNAVKALEQMPRSGLTDDMLSALESATERLRAVRGALDSFSVIVEHAPKLLGYPTPKRYLVFFQNNTELRPTGGFLGVYGVVTVDAATLTSAKTDDVYTLDGPCETVLRQSAPWPITRYAGVKQWYLRDANWSPDFPTSAQVMERFYFEEAAIAGVPTEPVDGVIAITPKVAEDILRIIGPITMNDKTYDADNFTDQLEFEVEMGFAREDVAYHARKAVVGVLLDEMVRRLSELPLYRLLEVVRMTQGELEEGHLLAYVHDADLQELVLAMDWGGKLKDVRGDYLSVIDANIAALKSDPAVGRTIAYSLAPAEGGGFESVARITYRHAGKFDWKTTRYRTYARVYVPAGSELISVDGAMLDDKLKDPARRPGKADTYQELGRTAFGAFISIEPGETRTLEFRYRASPAVVSSIAAGKYALDVEKQPGTLAHGLTLDLNFGKKLKSATPAEERSEFGDARYRYSGDLKVDWTGEARF